MSDNEQRAPKPKRIHPKPTTEQPDIETLQEWVFDSGCEATDGCWVEPDGQCEHGHQSWLRYLGMI